MQGPGSNESRGIPALLFRGSINENGDVVVDRIQER
jgi:hypothetical protein